MKIFYDSEFLNRGKRRSLRELGSLKHVTWFCVVKQVFRTGQEFLGTRLRWSLSRC